MEDKLRKALMEIQDLRMAVNILTDILWKMGRYIYLRTTDAELKANLLKLSEEIETIKRPRRR